VSALTRIGDDVARLVSHRVPIEEIARMFKGDARPGSLKIKAVHS